MIGGRRIISRPDNNLGAPKPTFIYAVLYYHLAGC